MPLNVISTPIPFGIRIVILIIYIIKQDIRIMFPIASQTAGPIGLTFFVDTQGWPGGDIG